MKLPYWKVAVAVMMFHTLPLVTRETDADLPGIAFLLVLPWIMFWALVWGACEHIARNEARVAAKHPTDD